MGSIKNGKTHKVMPTISGPFWGVGICGAKPYTDAPVEKRTTPSTTDNPKRVTCLRCIKKSKKK